MIQRSRSTRVEMFTVMMIMVMMVIPPVESWCTFSPLPSSVSSPQQQQQPHGHRHDHQPYQRSAQSLTQRQAKRESRDDENDASGAKDKQQKATWWQLLRRTGPEEPAEEPAAPSRKGGGGPRSSSSSATTSRRPTQKVPPASGKKKVPTAVTTSTKKKVPTATGTTKKDSSTDDGNSNKFPKFLPPMLQQQAGGKETEPSAPTTNENPSIVNRIQSLFNTTTQWSQPQVPSDDDGANKPTNPLSVVQKYMGSAATGSTQQLKSLEESFSGVQKFLSNAATGSMKRLSFTKSSSAEEWIPVFPKTRISPGEVVPATIAGIDLLVVASSDGRKLYCIANSCPHLGTPLETGMLERRPIETIKPQPSTFTGSRVTQSSQQQKQKASNSNTDSDKMIVSELDVISMLQQDGCEDCIVCPLHRTAFSLESGQVRGEWCPHPPIIGKIMGTVNAANNAAVFDIRYKGKNVEVRINTPIDT